MISRGWIAGSQCSRQGTGALARQRGQVVPNGLVFVSVACTGDAGEKGTVRISRGLMVRSESACAGCRMSENHSPDHRRDPKQRRRSVEGGGGLALPPVLQRRRNGGAGDDQTVFKERRRQQSRNRTRMEIREKTFGGKANKSEKQGKYIVEVGWNRREGTSIDS